MVDHENSSITVQKYLILYICLNTNYVITSSIQDYVQPIAIDWYDLYI